MFVVLMCQYFTSFFFFFNDTATTEIYTLSLHDALPISCRLQLVALGKVVRSNENTAAIRFEKYDFRTCGATAFGDRKSTRLNSSHLVISYAVFCLKKKNNTTTHRHIHFSFVICILILHA